MGKSKPLLAGITGGIGSGKSIICTIFQQLGIPVYDADSKARWLMENDSELRTRIIREFGADTYKEGILQREYLGKLVFPFPEKLKILNSLTHPAVGKDFENWVVQNSEYPYLIKEAALFIESGTYKSLDKLILVTASEEVRLARVMKRDPHRSETDIRNIMSRQMPDEEKIKFCDYEIRNNGNPVLQQVLNLDSVFRSSKG